jgi:MFS family permease
VGEGGAALVSKPSRRAARARVRLLTECLGHGFAAAAIVVGFNPAALGWRAVFFVGILPALFTLWVRRNVDEPDVWKAPPPRKPPERRHAHRFADILRGPMLRLTAALTFMNACALFGWWALNGWIPAYLSLPPAQGGLGLGTSTMSGFIVAMQVGMWLGYVSFGFITDVLPRKRVYVTYLAMASVLLPLYGFLKTPMLLLVMGPLVAFFGTGFFSGFGAVTAEVYPTSIRATAQGFTYNLGRVASAAAPFTIGSLATSHGFALAFTLAGGVYLLGALAWAFIPETRGRELA